MVAKFCSRSHGQPLPGVRSVAMISIRPKISREGGMVHRSLRKTRLCMPQDVLPAQRKQVKGIVVSTDWRERLTVLRQLMSDRLPSETALVLFSGGQDSATCLAWALQRFARVETLGFNYGQRHAVELECRGRLLDGMKLLRADWAARLGESHTLEIPTLATISDTALTRDVAIAMGEDGLPNTFVPGRNLVFLTFAAALA